MLIRMLIDNEFILILFKRCVTNSQHSFFFFLKKISDCHTIFLTMIRRSMGRRKLSINLCMVGRNSQYKALVTSFHFSYKNHRNPQNKAL